MVVWSVVYMLAILLILVCIVIWWVMNFDEIV